MRKRHSRTRDPGDYQETPQPVICSGSRRQLACAKAQSFRLSEGRVAQIVDIVPSSCPANYMSSTIDAQDRQLCADVTFLALLAVQQAACGSRPTLKPNSRSSTYLMVASHSCLSRWTHAVRPSTDVSWRPFLQEQTNRFTHDRTAGCGWLTRSAAAPGRSPAPDSLSDTRR